MCFGVIVNRFIQCQVIKHRICLLIELSKRFLLEYLKQVEKSCINDYNELLNVTDDLNKVNFKDKVTYGDQVILDNIKQKTRIIMMNCASYPKIYDNACYWNQVSHLFD